MTALPAVLALLIASIGLVTDLRTRRIPNWLTAGALIGGLAGGGKGAAIGAAAGAGAGTAGTAFTGNKDIVLPAESLLSFKLTRPLEVKK